MDTTSKTYWKVIEFSPTLENDGSLSVTLSRIKGSSDSSDLLYQDQSSLADSLYTFLLPDNFVEKDEDKHQHINDQWPYVCLITDNQGCQQTVSFNDIKIMYDTDKNEIELMHDVDKDDVEFTYDVDKDDEEIELMHDVDNVDKDDVEFTYDVDKGDEEIELLHDDVDGPRFKPIDSANIPFYKTKGARITAKALFWTGVVVATTALLALAGVALVALIASGAFGVAAAATVVTAATAMGAAVALAAITNLVANATVFSIAAAAALAIVAVGGAYIGYKGGKALVGYIKKKYVVVYIDNDDSDASNNPVTSLDNPSGLPQGAPASSSNVSSGTPLSTTETGDDTSQQVPCSATFSFTPNNFLGTQGGVKNSNSGTTTDTKEFEEGDADQQASVFSFNG